MKAKRRKASKLSNILLTGVAVIGWALWRFIRGEPIFDRGANISSATLPEKSHTKDSSPPLQSLSKTLPGNAPLDRLARTSSAEEPSDTPGEKANTSPANPALAVERCRDGEDEVLTTQSLDCALIPGWNLPAPDRLPVPTFAPAIMALGIVFVAMGLVTVWYVCVVGALIFGVAAWRWISELQGG